MKLKSVLLALAGVAAISTSAHATIPYSAGDLVLGLYDQTGTVSTSYELDLGNISVFTNDVTNDTTSSWAIGSDLNTIFGANWSNTTGSTNVLWAVAGTNHNSTVDGFASQTVYLTNPETTPGTANSTTLSVTGSNTTLDGNIYNQNFTGYHNLTAGAGGVTFTNATTVADTNGNSFDTRGATANGGGYGEGTANVVNGFSSGESNSVSDLDVVPTTGSETTLGSFSFSGTGTSGVLTFTPAEAVPEPSSYALGAVAMLLLVVLKRRQSARV